MVETDADPETFERVLPIELSVCAYFAHIRNLHASACFVVLSRSVKSCCVAETVSHVYG